MKLHELQAVPRDVRHLKSDPDFISIHAYLSSQGYVRVGRGAYGRVYRNVKQNKVLKVFKDDPRYIDWVNFCRENPTNPFVPKFRSKIINFNNGIYGVLLEELSRGDSDENAIVANIISCIVELLPNIKSSIKTSVWVRGLYDQYQSSFDYFLNNEEFLRVAKFLHKNRSRMDITEDNIMKRGNQWVITDPLAS